MRPFSIPVMAKKNPPVGERRQIERPLQKLEIDKEILADQDDSDIKQGSLNNERGRQLTASFMYRAGSRTGPLNGLQHIIQYRSRRTELAHAS
jgi:hypothetical protein